MKYARGGMLMFLGAFAGIHGACLKQAEIRLLHNMPAVCAAVVAPGGGRVCPSATGPEEGIIIPNRILALSTSLAEIRALVAPGEKNPGVTIAPGDIVEILVLDDGPGKFRLIRTRKQTYCWLSARDLLISIEN